MSAIRSRRWPKSLAVLLITSSMIIIGFGYGSSFDLHGNYTMEIPRVHSMGSHSLGTAAIARISDGSVRIGSCQTLTVPHGCTVPTETLSVHGPMPTSVPPTWAQAFPDAQPMPLVGSVMAYDAADGYMVLYGGYEHSSYPGHSVEQTWAYDSGTWRPIPTAASPPGGMGWSLAMDPATGCDFLFGVGGNNPFPFGTEGIISNGIYSNSSFQTWKYCHGAWTNVTTAPSPSPRYGMTVASDPECQCIVVFGGFGRSTPGALQDTWILRNQSWINVTSFPSPPSRAAAVMAYDSETQSLQMFGGGGDCYDPESPYLCNDTWELSFSPTGSAMWKQELANNSPVPNMYALGLSGSTNYGFTTFGGFGWNLPEYPYINYDLNSTWTFSGGNWSDATTSGPSPAARAGSAGGFDGHDNCSVLFGGEQIFTTYSHAWTFGDTWTYGCESVEFSMHGFPADLTWSTDVNGTTVNTTFSNATFRLGDGDYNYSINTGVDVDSPYGERYVATPSNGSVRIVGGPLVVNVTSDLQYRIDAMTQAGRAGPSVVPSVPYYDTWANPGSVFELKAPIKSGFAFVRWMGTGNGSISGGDPQITIVAFSPINETAIYVPASNPIPALPAPMAPSTAPIVIWVGAILLAGYTAVAIAIVWTSVRPRTGRPTALR